MATTEQVNDDYVLRTSVDDQASGPSEKIAASFDKVTQSAGDAAAAVAGVGGTVKTAADQITAAGAAWDRVARRNDDVTAATYRLQAAQEELARVQSLANKALAEGTANQDAVNNVLQKQQANVDRLTQLLAQVKAATLGAAEAEEVWEGRLQSGDQMLVDMATSAEAVAQAMMRGAAENIVYGSSLDAMRARWDPLFARQQQYQVQLAALTSDFSKGAVPVERLGAALDALTTQFGQGQAGIDQTRAKYDPLIAENLRYQEAVKALGNEIDQGLLPKLSEQQAALASLVTAHEKATEAITGTQAAAASFQDKTNAFAGVTPRATPDQQQQRGQDLGTAFDISNYDAARAAFDKTFAATQTLNAGMKDLQSVILNTDVEAEVAVARFNELTAAFNKATSAAVENGATADQTRAKYDPLFAETVRYTKALTDLEAEIKTGLITSYDLASTALNKVIADHEKVVESITGTNAALAEEAAQQAKAAAASAAAAAATDDLRAKYDTAYSARRTQIQQLQELQQVILTTNISATAAAAALDKINTSAKNAASGANAVTVSHGQAAFAVRQLGVQSVQFFSSLESGIPFMTAFVEQGHQIVDVALSTQTGFGVLKDAAKSAFAAITSTTGLVVTGVTAVVGAIVLMGYSAESSQRQLLALQTTLRATRDDYVGLAGQVNQASRNVASTSGLSVADARTAGTTIAATPNFQGTQKELEDLIRLSGDLAVVWGVKVPDAAKVLSDALQDPAKVAEDLATKHFPGMTAELARTVERMANAGDQASAYNIVQKALKDQTDNASASLTHLQQSLRDTANLFTSTKTSGSSWGDVINQTVADVIDHLNTLIRKIQEAKGAARDAQANAPQGPSPAAVNVGISEPFDSTVGQLPSVAARVDAASAAQTAAAQQQPDTRLPGLTDAMKNMALDAAKAVEVFNASMAKAVDIVKASPFGKLQDASDVVTRLSATLADLGNRTTENAKQFDTLSQSLQISQKALDDAQKAADAYFETATDKSVKSTEAQAQGQKDIAAAYADGNDAVIQATAYAKAYESALSDRLKPGTDEFTDAVIRMTVANVDSARAIGAVKAAEDSRNIDDQIALIKAETEAILNNTAANRANVQSIKDKQAVDKLGAEGASPDAQAHALAQRIQLDAATADKSLATSAASLADKYKPAEVAQLNEKIGEFSAKLKELGPRTEENAADVDRYSNAIKGAEAEITRLNKTHEAHRAELDKQKDKLLAQIDAQNKLTVAYGQGGDAVLQITASMKAQEQAISDGLKPGTEKYADAVKRLTQEQLAYATAQAETKAVQESNDITEQIKVVQTETTSLLDNSDARELMIQHMKDEYDVRNKNLGLSKPEQDALLAQKDTLAQVTQNLQNQRQTLSYLSQQFSSAFDTIGNAITQTFVQGEGSAVKWGNVMQGVLTQVLQAFAHLAIINPIMNSLFGQSNPTLSSALGLLGGGGGGGASSLVGGALKLVDLGGGQQGLALVGGGGGASGAVGGGLSLIGTQAVGAGPTVGGGISGDLPFDLPAGAFQQAAAPAAAAGGGSSLLSTGGNLITGIGLLDKLGFTNIGGQFSGITNSLGLTGSGGLFGSGSGLLSGVSSVLDTPLISGIGTQFGPVTSGLAEAGAGLPASLTVGSLIGGVGAGYGVGSLAGSYVQSALGKVGPAPQIGAATGAIAGAVIGSVVPVIGTLAGALIGGVIGGGGGGLIGPKAASAFSSTMVRINDQGFLDVGSTTAQRVDASGERSQALSDAQHINDILAQANVRVTSLAGGYNAPYFQIGQNTPGGFQDPSKFANFAAEFPSLRFSSQDPTTQAFIQGRSFASPEELQGVTTSLRDFENALKGTKAESDTMGIALRALAGAANTDVQPALQKAATFITSTFPTLTAGNRGSLATAQDQVTAQYGDALNEAQQIGFGYNELLDARQKLYEKNQIAANQQIDATANAVNSRYFAARAQVTGSPEDALTSQLLAFDTQAKQAHQQLSDTLLGIWGDAAATSADYQNRMAEDDKATAEERLAIQVQFNRQQVQLMEASNEQLMTLQARLTTAVAAVSGDPGQIQAAQVTNLDRSQQIERSQYFQSEQQTFGDNYATNDSLYQDKLNTLLAAQTYEMALLQQTIARQNLENQIASDQQNQNISVRGANAAAALYPSIAPQAAGYAFDVQAEQEQQNLYLSLTATYGNAYALTADYANKLAALQQTQGEERLVLEQQLNQKLRQQAIASWQQDITFTTRLQTAQAAMSGDPTRIGSASLSALYVQQVEEMQNLQEGLKQTYGDAYATTSDYYNKVVSLQDAQTAEMQLAMTQLNRQLLQQSISSQQQDQGFAVRASNATAALEGPQATPVAQLYAFDIQAQQEQTNLYLSLTATYGNAYASTKEYGDKINALVEAQGLERLVLQQQLGQQERQLQLSSAQQDEGFATRFENAQAQISGGPAVNQAARDALSVQQSDELENLKLSLVQTYGDAYQYTADYGDKITALAKAQGEERLALQQQQNDALASQASSALSTLNQYAVGLETSQQSPLSPQAQFNLAKTQFDTQSALAAGGNFAAVQTLQTYADNYLNSAHTLFGSGTDFVTAFGRVITALAQVGGQTPDALTASVLQTETRTQTAILVEQLQDLQDEVKQLRLQLVQGAATPARVS